MTMLDMRTTVFRIRKNSPSLRATIPEAYVQLLRLKDGDELEWDHENVNGEIVVNVRKAMSS